MNERTKEGMHACMDGWMGELLSLLNYIRTSSLSHLFAGAPSLSCLFAEAPLPQLITPSLSYLWRSFCNPILLVAQLLHCA